MIVRREVLNDWRVWLEVPVIVVVDEPELLATYIAEDQIAATRAEGKADSDEIEAGRRWRSDEWAEWRPNPGWPQPDFPRG